jgi:hypothetical protein
MYSNAKMLPEYDLLNEVFMIDSSSPTGLRYRTDVGKKIKAGQVAGAYSSSSTKLPQYIVGFRGKKLQVGRVVYKLATKLDPKGVIDHIDGNALNNRVENLQDITQRENLAKAAGQVINPISKGGFFSRIKKAFAYA